MGAPALHQAVRYPTSSLTPSQARAILPERMRDLRMSDLDESFTSQPFDGMQLLVRRDGRKMLVLNDSAQVCWEAMRSSNGSVGEVERALQATFGISAKDAQADVAGFLAQLLDEGAVEAVDTAPPACPPRSTRSSDHTLVVTLALNDVPIRIGFADRGLAEQALPRLRPLLRSNGGRHAHRLSVHHDGRVFSIWDGYRCLGRSADRDIILGVLVSECIDRSYPQARWAAVMHAATVGWRDGCVLIPGATGSGKSTLTVALVRSGLSYLGEDTAPIDGETGKVAPVPLAVALREPSWELLGDAMPAIGSLSTYGRGSERRRFLDLRDTAGYELKRPELIVLPRLEAGAPASLRRVRPVETLQAVIRAACWVSPEADLRQVFLDRLANVPALEVTYSNVWDCVGLVNATLGRTASASEGEENDGSS